MDKDPTDHLVEFLREHAPEPPEPRRGEEAKILAAVRALEEKQRPVFPAWKWMVPAATACAVALTAFLTFVARTPEPSTAGAEDVENYLRESLGVVQLADNSAVNFPEAGTRYVALAAEVSGETLSD